MNPKQIDSSDIDWDAGIKIAHGSFGVVKKAKYHGSHVAVKLSRDFCKKMDNVEEELRREAGMCLIAR